MTESEALRGVQHLHRRVICALTPEELHSTLREITLRIEDLTYKNLPLARELNSELGSVFDKVLDERKEVEIHQV